MTSRSELARYPLRLTVRLSTAEAGGLAAAADALELTPSETMRRLVRAIAGLPLAADGCLAPAVEALANQLRRIGVNLNQVVRGMHEGRAGVEDELLVATKQLMLAVQATQALYAELGRKPRQAAQRALGLAAEPHP
jgi:hypothetical protein